MVARSGLRCGTECGSGGHRCCLVAATLRVDDKQLTDKSIACQTDENEYRLTRAQLRDLLPHCSNLLDRYTQAVMNRAVRAVSQMDAYDLGHQQGVKDGRRQAEAEDRAQGAALYDSDVVNKCDTGLCASCGNTRPEHTLTEWRYCKRAHSK